MALETIRVRRIQVVSPTLAESLRQCKLRAGLSRAEGSSRHVLGNPKAWLGTAYHAVLEAAGNKHGEDIEASVRHLWNSAVEAQYERSRSHPFDKRFGRPESWPGYHMVAAMVLVRARELVASASAQSISSDNDRSGGATWCEKTFSGANSKMVGRPDVVRPEEVVDFKTGDVFEDEDLEHVKTAYVRQLRLYAFLVNGTLGWWPRRGVLLPMAGSPVTVELGPEECEAEAAEAIRLLDEYNEILSRSADAAALAGPSPANCRWCQYQLYCPAFWGAVGPGWKDDLRSSVVAGRAVDSPAFIHGGAALSVSLQAEEGTAPSGEIISLFPLDPLMHTDLPQVQGGDRIRVTGLWRRTDDSVVPSIRTIIAQKDTLPRIVGSQ